MRTTADFSIAFSPGRMASLVPAVCLALALGASGWAQTGAKAPQPATSTPAAPSIHSATDAASPPGPALALYRRLLNVGLDPAAVYNIRDAALQREDLHITLDDGTIAFLQSVDGKITGAIFEGEGEVLLVPPNVAERGSLALFTGAAILEEKFNSAYLRFNDETAAELQPALRPAEDASSFISKWDRMTRSLTETDSLRLMVTYLNQPGAAAQDRLLRARLHGNHLGVFDAVFDTLSAEQIAVFKLAYAHGAGYYDVLASFPMRSSRLAPGDGPATGTKEGAAVLDRLHIASYRVKARVEPPRRLEAQAMVDAEVLQGGDRILFFELSRFLKLSNVQADGNPVEFLQNEAIEGSLLARRGNDVVAVVFPEPLRNGQRLQLTFDYAGDVMAEAGGGLLYVGARGIWYPNRGMLMANYDLEFRYPLPWTLVATGKLVSHEVSGDEQVSHYVSEQPLPLAGFNLGQYTEATAKAGDVLVEAYASRDVKAQVNTIMAPSAVPSLQRDHEPAIVVPAPNPPPSRQAEGVAQTVARAIDSLGRDLGPFPYSSLALSEIPDRNSQGWPGLVFLSSLAFLTPEERAQAHLRPFESLLADQFMVVHETAHQWWGDLITWKSYRDQWLSEALSNYSAILALEKTRPQECKALLEHYRGHLLSKNGEGEEITSAGAVTLGLRLSSSHFPDGYDAVSYGRGTWLMHMLRTMMRDAAARNGETPGEEPFLVALRNLRQRYQGQAMSTQDFQRALEEVMPEPLRYEGQRSLDWFFGAWVYGGAIPRLELKDVKFNRKPGAVTVSARILQREAPDQLVTSVPVYASTGSGLVLVARVFADGPETTLRLTVPADTKKLVLDPYGTVLTRP